MKYSIPFFYDYVFPNMILPNASITELGIVNYIHSIYSNRIRSNNFFEESNNAITQLFDNSLGTWPNSLLNHGLNLHAGCYEEYLELVEKSVYFGKQSTDKYIYPIKVSPHMDDFIGVNVKGKHHRLNGEYFWKHMSAEALADAQSGRAIIFLDYGQENYFEKESFNNLHTSLEYSGIPKENIILAFNSFNAQELYESWFTPDEQRLQVRNWPFVVTNTSFHYARKPDVRMDENIFNSTRNIIRDNYFLFKVRRPRAHRLALLYKLATENLLDKGDWSCLESISIDSGYIDTIKYGFDFTREGIQAIQQMIPHSLQSEPGSNNITVGPWTDHSPDAHKNSYFYICTETYVHGEYTSLTEKVFKPIVNFQPFLFVAYPGALKMLQKLGFKTFAGFIDESYDSEQDEVTRLQMIYKEIAKLCSMTKEELHQWYWSMEDILKHNHQHFLSLHKNETQSLDLIKYLHARVTK